VIKLEENDWSLKMLQVSTAGKKDLEKAGYHLEGDFERRNKHEKIVEGARCAVEFLKLYSSATERASQIIEQHKQWIDTISYCYEIKGIDFENHCINLHFERYFNNKTEPFTLVYDSENERRPWGYKVVHGDMLITTGLSDHYLDGIKDVLKIFIDSKMFEGLIKKNSSEKAEEEKKDHYYFCRKHFDTENIRDSKDRVKLYRLLEDPAFYKILTENKLTEVIDSHRLFLQAMTTRKAEIRLKQMVSNACVFHEMPKPPGSFCKAKETAGMGVRSGIYFGWRESQCFYVGKSKNIEKRFKSHEVINLDDDVSWLEFSEADIHLNELFYIWLLEPECNDEKKQKDKADIALTNKEVIQ
jgi:hypothetical protein